VIAPDWDSAAADNGRGDLLASVRFAQDRAEPGDGLVVVGWSMGGVAAAGLAVNAAQHDVIIRHTICLAGAFMAADPISGRVPATDLPGSAAPSPFTLLHGLGDDVVPVSASREFAAALEKHQWPVESVELDADHASIAGAGYDPVAGRYFPADDPGTLAVAADVADRIAAVFR
jgi:dienelactone hydrolase